MSRGRRGDASHTRRQLLGLPDTGRDALILAALGPPAHAAEAWRRWTSIAADAFGDPIAQRWLPLIDRHLPPDALDASERRRLREASQGLWVRNVRVIEAAIPAIQALEDAGVRVMLLKGAALALTAYDSLALRPIGDVDLLIEPEHGATARDVLARLGWRPLRRGGASADPDAAHGLDLYRPPFGLIDVHWYLVHECCWRGADRGVWQRARPFARDALRAQVPSAADLLFHTCIHGLRWSPVHAAHWLADAAWVIRSAGSDLHWAALVEEASARHLGHQAHEALRVVEHWTGATVPAWVFDRLAAQPVSWSDRLECRLKGRPVVSVGGLFVIWRGWVRTAAASRQAGLAVPSWRRYLAAAVGIDQRQIPAWVLHHLAGWARARAGVGRSGRGGTSRRMRTDVQ